MADSPLKVWFDREGRLLRLRLSRPKANILDAEMMAAIDAALAEHLETDGLVGVLVDHEGPNFSFGASVEEHLPGQCDAMLKGMHGLVKRMVASSVPILTAVNGQCLGGGMEVACAGNLIFAAADARFGQPEIKLAVFAPAASALLPERMGQARAEDILISGRTVSGGEAAVMGIVNQVAVDPEQAALDYFDTNLADLSASSLRYAVQAVRGPYAARVAARLDEVEELYLKGLMESRDATEGLEAFIAKRPAQWEHR